MKKRILSFFAALLVQCLLLTVLTSCMEKEPPEKYSELSEFPVKVQNITLEEEPQFLVSLSKDADQALKNLGMDVNVIGIGKGGIQPKDRKVPVLGTAQKPDFDGIYRLYADLVITDFPFPNSELERFSEQGCQVLVLSAKDPKTAVKEYEEVLRLLKGNPETKK